MTGMDDFCSQCQERPEEGPCRLHGSSLTEHEQEALRLTDEEQVSAHEAMQEGEWQWFGWLYLRKFERVLDGRRCRHAELPDTAWRRLRLAEESAAYRLALVKSVVAFVDANLSDLPLTLLEEMRAEAQR